MDIVFATLAALITTAFAVGLIALVFWASRSFEGVFGATVFLFCLDAMLTGLPILNVGRNIQIFDPIAIGLFLSACFRLLFGAQKGIAAPHWLLLAMFTLICIPLGLGFKDFGMAAAPDFRWFFHFMALALYSSSFAFDQIDFRRLAKYMLIAGAALVMLVLFRWAAEAFGLSISKTWAHLETGQRFRVLNAAQAFFIAQAAIVLLAARQAGLVPLKKTNKQTARHRSVSVNATPWCLRWSLIGAAAGLLIAMSLLHRSVWVAVAAGLLLFAYQQPDQRRDLFRIAGVAGLIAMIVLVPAGLFGFLDNFFDAFTRAFSEVGERHSSFADRYLGWLELLTDWWNSGSAITYAFGLPFGSGYYRKIAEFGASYAAEYTPHNFYVQTLLRTGVIGLTIFLSLMVVTANGLYRSLRASDSSNSMDGAVRRFLLIFMLMQAVFFLAYGARLEHGLIFGLAMSAAASGRALRHSLAVMQGA